MCSSPSLRMLDLTLRLAQSTSKWVGRPRHWTTVVVSEDWIFSGVPEGEPWFTWLSHVACQVLFPWLRGSHPGFLSLSEGQGHYKVCIFQIWGQARHIPTSGCTEGLLHAAGWWSWMRLPEQRSRALEANCVCVRGKLSAFPSCGKSAQKGVHLNRTEELLLLCPYISMLVSSLRDSTQQKGRETVAQSNWNPNFPSQKRRWFLLPGKCLALF